MYTWTVPVSPPVLLPLLSPPGITSPVQYSVHGTQYLVLSPWSIHLDEGGRLTLSATLERLITINIRIYFRQAIKQKINIDKKLIYWTEIKIKIKYSNHKLTKLFEPRTRSQSIAQTQMNSSIHRTYSTTRNLVQTLKYNRCHFAFFCLFPQSLFSTMLICEI